MNKKLYFFGCGCEKREGYNLKAWTLELCNLQSKQNMHTNVQINRINAKTNADVIVIVNRDEDQRIQQGQEVWGGGGERNGERN